MSRFRKSDKLLAQIERRVEATVEAGVVRIIKRRAVVLLNRFQARTKYRVELASNCDTWLWDAETKDRAPFREVWSAAQSAALNALADGFCRVDMNRHEQRYVRYFPELVELAWLAFKLDKLPGRPEMNFAANGPKWPAGEKKRRHRA